MNAIHQTAIQDSNVKITPSKLIRWSGLSAVAAGLIFAAIQPIHPPDVLASVNTSFWTLITGLKTVMCIFGLLGIAGLYARQVKETGWLGLLGYLLLTVFYAIQICYAFAEVLILPLLTTMAPAFVESSLGLASGAVGTMNLGAFATVYSLLPLLYLLGLLLFGIAMFRAHILPRGATVLLAVSGPLALLMVALLPHQFARFAAMPMGLALAWLGFALWSERRTSASEPLAAKGSPQRLQTAAE